LLLFPLLNNTLSIQPRQAFYPKKKGEFLIFYLINNQLGAGEKLRGAVSGGE
jgi:hypothetical protein